MDPPTLVTFKPSYRPSPAVTRSQVERSATYQVGAFYAKQMDTSRISEEFCIAKCVKPCEVFFEGILLEKCDVVEDLLYFVEKDMQEFQNEKLIYVIISINLLVSDSKKYSIHKEEYEQLVLSLD